jgi:hypothetical protein
MHGYVFRGLVLSGRIAALCIGCLAIYVGFFLYPDQEGQLQNRIEDFWVTVHDRALETGSTSVALFNRTAGAVQRAFSRIFGHAIFSLQLVINSSCLSLSGIALAVSVVGIVDAFRNGFSPQSFEMLLTVPPAVCACAALWRPQRRLLLAAALPLSFVCVARMMLVGDHRTPLYRAAIILTCALLGSLVSDAIAVAIVKWSLGTITAQRSLRTIFKRLILTGLTVPACIVFPLAGTVIVDIFPSFARAIHYDMWWSFALLGFMNLTTSIYCLIPAGVFLFVLAHRIVWPVLNRLIFPVARFQLLRNRRAMAAIGSLGILTGLGLTDATLEAVLKLFG